MDPRLQALEMKHGVFLRREALDAGWDDKSIRRALKLNLWTRVRHGAYIHTSTWQAADDAGRYGIRARAVMRSLGDKVALSHTSAVAAHGIDVWGADLEHIHVTRLDGGAARVEGDVIHHRGRLDPAEVTTMGEHLIVSPTRAVLQMAAITSAESGLVSADSALHQRLVTKHDLEDLFHEVERHPGSQHVRLVVKLADGGAESVGESRSRYLFWCEGLPMPQLQFRVYARSSGLLIAVTDFAWPEHRLFGEFDGKVKYGRLLKPGQDPGDVVFDEKRREDEVREETGFGFGRLTWLDTFRRRETGHRFRRLLGLAA